MVDINRNPAPDRFMLQFSTDIFTWVADEDNIFDLMNHQLYGITDIANHEYNFQFYEKEDDEDYMGVAEIIC